MKSKIITVGIVIATAIIIWLGWYGANAFWDWQYNRSQQELIVY